jgi:hypothetical protein
MGKIFNLERNFTMPIFVLVYFLFLLGICAVITSPVPTGRGKRIILFLLGVSLWVGAYIIVRSQQETLVDFLFSDWALSGALANQVAATLVLFGFGWYTFIASSIKTELPWGDRQQPQEVEIVKVFRPWPGILVWIPAIALMVGIWIIPG